MKSASYTVKQLAELSGVSVRTLHFYHEIGLLEPESVGENSYRIYAEPQLLRLQQILFYRELGFELKKIKDILNSADFELPKALANHRAKLDHKILRLQNLIHTIDQTLHHLHPNKGGPVKPKDLYHGFAPEKQAEYEEYIQNRYDLSEDQMQRHRDTAGKLSKEEMFQSQKDWEQIVFDLAQELHSGAKAGDPRVQAIIARHHRWLGKFWTPERESYIGLGAGYTEFEWKKAFAADPDHPRLARFMSEAMKLFANHHLPENAGTDPGAG